MEVCLRVAQIEESSQGITAASHCSKGWWILNHLSNSSWTCGQDDFMAGWSLWGWKIKRDFLAPLPFSWLLIFSFQSPHINHAYMSNFFAASLQPSSSSYFVPIVLSLLIISVELRLFGSTIRALQRCRDVKSLEAAPWASASHSCVTSTPSQPSATGRHALQPSDL